MFDPEEQPRPACAPWRPSMWATTVSFGILILPLLLLAASLLGGPTLRTFVMRWDSSALRLVATLGVALTMGGLAILERRSAD